MWQRPSLREPIKGHNSLQTREDGQGFWGVLTHNLNTEDLSDLHMWNCGVNAIQRNVLCTKSIFEAQYNKTNALPLCNGLD